MLISFKQIRTTEKCVLILIDVIDRVENYECYTQLNITIL